MLGNSWIQQADCSRSFENFNVTAQFDVSCDTHGQIKGRIMTSNVQDANNLEGALRQSGKERGHLIGQLNHTSARVIALKIMITAFTRTFSKGSPLHEFHFKVTEQLQIEHQKSSPPYVIDLQFGLINFLFSNPTLHPRLYGKSFRFKLAGQHSAISNVLTDWEFSVQ
jgi:hypothetical protein